MSTAGILQTIIDVLSLLAIIPGFWIGMKFLTLMLSWTSNNRIRSWLSNRAVGLVLLLALGGLFTSPLLEILGLIHSLLRLSINPESSIAPSGGPLPEFFFTLVTLFLFTGVYALVFWLGKGFLRQPLLNRSRNEQPGRLEKVFILLAIASLVYQTVRNIVYKMVLFQLPGQLQPIDLGVAGFLSALAMGLALLVITIFVLNNFISSEDT